MRILFTSGKAFLPQNSGGVQSSTMQLAGALMARGHEVAVMSRLIGGGWTEFGSRIKRRVGRTRFSCDRGLGLPVYRAWDPTDATEVAKRFRPDVAVVQSGETMKIAKSLESAGVPVVLYFRHVEFADLGGNPVDLTDARYIANSAFTAAKYNREFGVTSTIIPPLVEASQYQTQTTRENVTFINPYPVKGRDLAFDIAQRCPDIPFTFCESWRIDDELRAWITNRITQTPNVTLRPRTNDMKSIYGKAKVLLAPSIWEEAWGRVATEAHFSAIPVLGSRQGGLPEAIGPGGTVLDIGAPVDDWVGALRKLWDDPDHYAALSDAARAYSRRAEIDPDHQIETLIGVLRDAADAAQPNPPITRADAV
ncbi:glycosyltransferase [Phaeovulum sp.]|uniref:glycosyltransferase n=1 Tax=Phaeovulum sp. TaxID=2934796 RepID=UPI0039E6241F